MTDKKAGYQALEQEYGKHPIAQSMSIIQSAHPFICLIHVVFKAVSILRYAAREAATCS